MVIWSEFRLRQYRDNDYWEDAPHFTTSKRFLSKISIILEYGSGTVIPSYITFGKIDFELGRID